MVSLFAINIIFGLMILGQKPRWQKPLNSPWRVHLVCRCHVPHHAVKNVHQVKIRDWHGHTKLDTTNVYMRLSKNDKKGLTDPLTENLSWAQDANREDDVINLFN